MDLEYDRFFSKFGIKLTEQPLRHINALVQNATGKLITLAAGNPNNASFPFESISMKLKDGSCIELNGADLNIAMQYSVTQGSLKYQKILRELVCGMHDPPCWNKSPDEGNTVIMPTAGSTDGINQIFRLLLDPGDKIIVEEFTYPGPITFLKSMQLNPVPVSIDADGMIPGELAKVLSRWDPDAKTGTTDKPKLIYLIPTGQNPCGSALTLERKRQIYKLAQQYNLLILEDDPYFLINFEERIPSFLSMDTDGRVIRLDSFSKSLSPGLRAGYMTGPEAIMIKARMALGISSHGTSAISQGIVTALLTHWTYDGYLARAKEIAEFYKKQRDFLIKCAEKWLKGLVEYSIPISGMFLWIKIVGCSDTKDLMFKKAVSKGMIATPGECFQPIVGIPSPFIRIAFSGQTEDMDEGLRILADVLEEARQESQ